ncbi:MAG: family 20 glycosylhydrolase [Armatimonadota bacterium]|nr:family 20 glycosylhydrolase [Armatimonadota bacterium]
MQVAGWTIDLAREQSLPESTLSDWLDRSARAGYNSVGLYLEHRYAYPSAPQAAASGCLTPSVASSLVASSPVRVIPFLNTLGHMEGFMRSEGLQWLSEGHSDGSAQMCPSRPECVSFAQSLVSDALSVFTDEWVHLGGDETRQLGQCELCTLRDKSMIYADYFGSLCKWVLSQGRRPCLWADMLIEHPEVLDLLPKETVLFDWQYHQSPLGTSRAFRDAGFDVVCCPAVRSYDSAWCHLDATYENVDAHSSASEQIGALGVFVTTWEFSYFTNYFSTLPIIFAAGRRLGGESWEDALLAEGGDEFVQMADIVGRKIEETTPFLASGQWRKIRQNMVLSQDPFRLWRVWREEACGPVGDRILELAGSVTASSPEIRYPAEFYAFCVNWVRSCEHAYRHYKMGETESAANVLKAAADSFDTLIDWMGHFSSLGGSAADVHRAMRLKIRVIDVASAVSGLQKYLPAFEILSHPAYIPGDQAAWRTGQY